MRSILKINIQIAKNFSQLGASGQPNNVYVYVSEFINPPEKLLLELNDFITKKQANFGFRYLQLDATS